MSKNVPITLACGDYEITRALKQGLTKPDGIDLTILTASDSATRHWRFLRKGEFDVCELSASAYLAAREHGMPIRAIPVFPHRRFRHGFVFINTGKNIRKPTDLKGRKIGVKSFLVTATLWTRGILEHEYGVPHRSIEWFSELEEDIEFNPPKGLSLTRIPASESPEEMLLAGELDALLLPDLLSVSAQKDPRVARLFPDYKEREIEYFNKTGIFPIMHVVAIREDILAKQPWIAGSLFNAFNQSKDLAMKRMENPRIVPLAWYREAWEEQEHILGSDPWEYGLTERNRKNFETLTGYAAEQGILSAKIPLEELFIDVSEGFKRGGFRI